MAGDIKLKYLASVTLETTGLQSLAASQTLVAGYETAAVDVGGMANGPPTDILLSGHFKANNTAHTSGGGNIEVWVIAAENDTPIWPDVFDGTAGAVTVNSRRSLGACGMLAATISGDAVNDRVYTFAPVSVASLFGGVLPDQFVVFVTHNIHTTTATWATTNDHAIYYTPVLAQYT